MLMFVMSLCQIFISTWRVLCCIGRYQNQTILVATQKHYLSGKIPSREILAYAMEYGLDIFGCLCWLVFFRQKHDLRECQGIKTRLLQLTSKGNSDETRQIKMSPKRNPRIFNADICWSLLMLASVTFTKFFSPKLCQDAKLRYQTRWFGERPRTH